MLTIWVTVQEAVGCVVQLLRLLRLLRLFRLVRMIRLARIFRRWESHIGISYSHLMCYYDPAASL